MASRHAKPRRNGTAGGGGRRRQHGGYAALFGVLGVLQLAAVVPLMGETAEAAMILLIIGIFALGVAVYHAVEASQQR